MKVLMLAVTLAALSHSVDSTPDPEFRAQVGVCQPIQTHVGILVQCWMVEDLGDPHRSEDACKNRLRQMLTVLRRDHPNARLMPQCASNVLGLPI